MADFLKRWWLWEFRLFKKTSKNLIDDTCAFCGRNFLEQEFYLLDKRWEHRIVCRPCGDLGFFEIIDGFRGKK